MGSCDGSVKVCRAAEGGFQALQKAEVRGRPDNAMRHLMRGRKMFTLLLCTSVAVEAAGKAMGQDGTSTANVSGGIRVMRE